MDKSYFDKGFLIILLVLFTCLILITGCEEIKPTPSIKSIDVDKPTVIREENFKVFFTVYNPTGKEFIPYIRLDYDDQNIKSQDYDIGRKEVVALKEIAKIQEKTYYLSFLPYSRAESDDYNIKIYLYEDEEAFTALGDPKTVTIRVVEDIK